jgi:hypothetical protein
MEMEESPEAGRQREKWPAHNGKGEETIARSTHRSVLFTSAEVVVDSEIGSMIAKMGAGPSGKSGTQRNSGGEDGVGSARTNFTGGRREVVSVAGHCCKRKEPCAACCVRRTGRAKWRIVTVSVVE